MKIRISKDGESEILDVGSLELDVFESTERHTMSNKVPHIKGDAYIKIMGIQPTDSDILRHENFVWLSGNMARDPPENKFPLVYIPEGHGISVSIGHD